MKKPKICAAIINKGLQAIRDVEPQVDLFEVRIDLIGEGWPQLTQRLKKPWIACNRLAGEGGNWKDSEARRIKELLKAVELGADIVDIELATENLGEVVPGIKNRAKCLLSFHDVAGTPSLDKLQAMVQRQLEAGADICKVVTTARRLEDNLTVLRLISDFPKARMVSFAMGPLGSASRILCPLVGGDFIYASIDKGKESAAGQLTVAELRKIYGMMADVE